MSATGPTQGTPPFISYRGVYKSFGDKAVLKGVDLDVYHGETLVILGRSGSGKTVMTSMLVGLTACDRGKITVGGQDITRFKSDADWRALRLNTGYLFQGSALYDSMTVGQNVAFPMVQHTDWSDHTIRERVLEKLSQVGLSRVFDLEPSELSGGMQRRAALARSLALDPKLIIYDEPTAGLDPITGDAIGHLIRRLQQDLGVTSVVVTHDLRLAQLVADRLVLFYEGNWAFEGAYEEFLHADHLEVRRFLHLEAEEEANTK
jgi:phospholipid/cholesterol/gamma-HCH transport system ATP-binding protein